MFAPWLIDKPQVIQNTKKQVVSGHPIIDEDQ